VGRSFGAVAGGCAALRPGYPADAVAFLVAGAGRVLDLGAGTGLLTEARSAGGAEVLAVDPSAGMLGQLAARLPGVETVAGTAESLPVGDGSVDAVVAGHAAHWFEPAPAAREMRRVLRPGGVVGFIWNVRDERTPWAAALGTLLADHSRDHREDYEVVVSGFARELHAEIEPVQSAVVQRLTPEQVVGLIGTRSYVATMPPTGPTSSSAGSGSW
jgi:SAM-dependent methyltransferase